MRTGNSGREVEGSYAVQTVLARVRVLVVTTTTAVFSIAAGAAVLSTEVHKSLFNAVISALPKVEPAAHHGAYRGEAAALAAVPQTAAEVPADAPPPAPMFSQVDEMPFSGVIAERSLSDAHEADAPLLVFTPRQFPPLDPVHVVQTAFVSTQPAPQAMALARTPNARPDFVGPGAETASPLLAYARAPSAIDEPFSAVLGGRAAVLEDENDGLYRPRPRPNAEVLTAWLDGRAPAQFAPGHHEWVQNPLPASVYAEKQQRCLAEGIYFEARGESEEGQAAVAQVILNRVRNPAYPGTICGVVYQNEHRRHSCQFSFACDGHAEIIRSQASWRVAQRIAEDVTDGKIWLDEVGDSTHYHANYVAPRWGRRMIKVDKIGAHIFYRTRFGGWS